MPLYCYICPQCDRTDLKFAPMSEASTPVACECGADMARDFRAERAGNHMAVEFKKPIEMFSVGLNTDDEIREFKQRCPDVDVATDPDDDLYGVPIARNRQQKLAALDAVGFEEKN